MKHFPLNTIEYDMTMTALASMPKDKAGYIDIFEVYRLCAKFDIDFQMLENAEPYELLLTLEGKLEMQREYFEFLNYSLYSAIGQLLSGKKKYENPFDKKEEKVKEKPTKEIQQHTMDVLEDIFKINNEEN